MVKLCSPELSQSSEALLARIEKLENEIAVLKARCAVQAGDTAAYAAAKTAAEEQKNAAETPNPDETASGNIKMSPAS